MATILNPNPPSMICGAQLENEIPAIKGYLSYNSATGEFMLPDSVYDTLTPAEISMIETHEKNYEMTWGAWSPVEAIKQTKRRDLLRTIYGPLVGTIPTDPAIIHGILAHNGLYGDMTVKPLSEWLPELVFEPIARGLSQWGTVDISQV